MEKTGRADDTAWISDQHMILVVHDKGRYQA